ncbi:MAG: RNB domain-containing ribonuclease, partial [Rhizobiaceae bacterium]|nr:RNB domain-containing ribonuclease [Rhizobiaceae bacterium]
MARAPRSNDRKQQARKSAGAEGGRSGGKLPGIVHGEVPPREILLEFIQDNPDRANKREIAKAFGLKGDARIALKAALRALEDDGLLEKNRKSLTRPGALPPVTVLDITTRDVDGQLIGRPAEWLDENGVAPAVLIRQPSGSDRSRGKTPVAGIGDRVVAKIFPNKERGGPAYTARIIKVIDKRKTAALGVYRAMEDGKGRILPIDRRGIEMEVDAEFRGDARDGDLVEVETVRMGRFGLQRARVLSVVGSVTSEKAISMIAIHAHGIPYIFPPHVLREAEAAGPAGMTNREDWRALPLITIDPADAKDHDDAVHAEPDTAPDNPGGMIVVVAIADVSWYVRPGSALDREALKRGNSVYFPDRVVPMLPER